MAILRIGHRVWWSHFPFLGKVAPVEREERTVAIDPSLRMKVTQRPKGWWDFMMGLGFINWATGWLRKSFNMPDGDHLVIDTGKRLVNLSGDRLDISGVRVGDDVEFQLDSAVDPGGATYVKGKVVTVHDGPDPGIGGRPVPAPPAKLDRPIDPKDPVGDLIVRRAELFQAFKNGELDQEELRDRWDTLRRQALDTVTKGSWSYFEKKDQVEQLLETGAYTVAEFQAMGIDLASYGVGVPETLAV